MCRGLGGATPGRASLCIFDTAFWCGVAPGHCLERVPEAGQGSPIRYARSCTHLASPLIGLPMDHACVSVHLLGPNAPAIEAGARCMRAMSCSRT